MAKIQITLTPNVVKKELIIGIQKEEQGRLLLANIPTLEKTGQIVLAGDLTDKNFYVQVEKALSSYVARPHYIYTLINLLEGKGA